jgi:uncharacterized membrane protein
MIRSLVHFANLLLAALVVGTMFGLWIGFNPMDLPAGVYVEQQQRTIRALQVVMPVLGAVTVVLTLAAALLSRSDRRRYALLVGALLAFVASGVVTRFLNQPINTEILTWSALAPPARWSELRDAWWHWHVVRMILGLVGLGLLIAANLLPQRWARKVVDSVPRPILPEEL